jgi:hypothetical protein
MREARWKEALIKCDKGKMMLFLRYICEHDRVQKTESLRQYWKQFNLLHFRMNGFKVDPNDAKEARKVCRPH